MLRKTRNCCCKPIRRQDQCDTQTSDNSENTIWPVQPKSSQEVRTQHTTSVMNMNICFPCRRSCTIDISVIFLGRKTPFILNAHKWMLTVRSEWVCLKSHQCVLESAAKRHHPQAPFWDISKDRGPPPEFFFPYQVSSKGIRASDQFGYQRMTFWCKAKIPTRPVEVLCCFAQESCLDKTQFSHHNFFWHTPSQQFPETTTDQKQMKLFDETGKLTTCLKHNGTQTTKGEFLFEDWELERYLRPSVYVPLLKTHFWSNSVSRARNIHTPPNPLINGPTKPTLRN